MYGDELLQTSHSPETKHGPFSSSKGEVRIFHPIVFVTADLLAVLVADLFHGGTVGRTPIRDDDPWASVSFHCFL